MDLIDRVIAREGGSKLVRDPADPGGLTKYGISHRSFPNVDIANLTYDQARTLYRLYYLEEPRISLIKDDYLRELVFDYAVHSGPPQAIKALQKLVGAKVDGILGPETAFLANSITPDLRFYLAYLRERLLFLARVIMKRPTSLKYLAGWVSRVLSI